MHIFYAADDTPNAWGLPESKLWYVNLYLPLKDLGHTITRFTFDYSEINQNLNPAIPQQRAVIDRVRPILSEELLRQVKQAHAKQPIDLFFSYFYGAHVEPEVIRRIGDMGITTMNWYCNGSYQFQLVEEIAPAYHYCLVPEKFRLDDYRRVGANPIYCQEAANPNIYKAYDLPQEYDVTFVGQRYGNRPGYIAALADNGIDVRVWGPHWQKTSPPIPLWRYTARRLRQALSGIPPEIVIAPARCGPPLSDDELVKMYSRSKLSLGFTTVIQTPRFGRPIKQVRLRDFEATMSGACYLVEYFDELTDFFEPDKEMICFSSPDELIEKTRYYLAHDTERERIRLAGMRRAQQEHTWHKRFETVFRQIGMQ
jgi:spore maturation protein CgeB